MSTPNEPTALILDLPPELFLHIFNFLYDDWFLDNLLSPSGLRHLAYRHELPDTPWKQLALVCKHLRALVLSHRAFVTTLHPAKTARALEQRIANAPIHILHTDIWAWAVNQTAEPGHAQDVTGATERALSELDQARTFRLDSEIMSADQLKLDLLQRAFQALSTTRAANLQEMVLRSTRAPDVAEAVVLASAAQLWGAGPDSFPQLERIELHNIPYTSHSSTFPPPCLTSLELSACAIPTGIDGLIYILNRLPRLRTLDLSRLSQFSPSIAFEKRGLRSVPLPMLQRLRLQDFIPAIENILYHLDFPITTKVKFVSIPSMGNEQVDGTELLFGNIARDIHSRWGGAIVVDTVELSVRRHWPQIKMDVKVAGQKKLSVDFDWSDGRCDGMGVFISELGVLRSTSNLTIGPAMSNGLTFQGYDRAPQIRRVLQCFPNVVVLKVQGNIAHLICDNLQPTCDHPQEPVYNLMPSMRELTISDITAYDELTACYCWQREGLKLTFIACPGLVNVPWQILIGVVRGQIDVDFSKVEEQSELQATIEGLTEEEQPHDEDDDWAPDGNNSGYEMEDYEMEDDEMEDDEMEDDGMEDA
ncbi:unnamed protein product [Peniophora sp. CBMAI 1063]|nr:unnamed protein product [Peniophora sp. CBMAI 1063]